MARGARRRHRRRAPRRVGMTDPIQRGLKRKPRRLESVKFSLTRVRITDPLERGLKQSFQNFYSYQISRVRMTDPLERGLKHRIPFRQPHNRRRSRVRMTDPLQRGLKLVPGLAAVPAEPAGLE